jgi:hypothetical protein
MGVLLLVVTPTLSYGWGGLWTWVPDLTVVIAALALLLAVATALRVIGLLRAEAPARLAISVTTKGKPDHVSA